MTKDKEKNVIKQYLENIESSVICENFQISRSTLGRVIKRNNIPKRKIVRPKMEPKYKYVEGKIFNHLKVLEVTDNALYKDNTYCAICECLLCGRKDYKIRPYDVINGISKSCGCNKSIYAKTGSDCYNYTGFKNISGQRWASIRLGAEKRNLDFEIKIADVWKMYQEQKEKCALSDMKIYFGETNKSKFTASLDRIDSKKGYT